MSLFFSRVSSILQQGKHLESLQQGNKQHHYSRVIVLESLQQGKKIASLQQGKKQNHYSRVKNRITTAGQKNLGCPPRGSNCFGCGSFMLDSSYILNFCCLLLTPRPCLLMISRTLEYCCILVLISSTYTRLRVVRCYCLVKGLMLERVYR